jgi:hypothetical protein
MDSPRAAAAAAVAAVAGGYCCTTYWHAPAIVADTAPDLRAGGGASALAALSLLHPPSAGTKAPAAGLVPPLPAPTAVPSSAAAEDTLRISIPHAFVQQRKNKPKTKSSAGGGDGDELETKYEITVVNCDNQHWTVYHRYNDFRILLQELCERHDRLDLSFLPSLPRRYRGIKRFHPSVVGARREALQLFLRAAATLPNLATDKAFLDFVGFVEAEHDGTALRKMRQRTVTELDQKILGHLHRAGSAVLMADLAEEATPDMEGQLLISSLDTSPASATSSGPTSYWCELRDLDISYFTVRGNDGSIAGTIHTDESSVVDGVPPAFAAAAAEAAANEGCCLTLVNATESRLFIISFSDEDAKAAWFSAIHKAKGDIDGITAIPASVVDANTMGDDLLAALEQREVEAAAKRRLRRKTFLMEDSFLQGIG